MERVEHENEDIMNVMRTRMEDSRYDGSVQGTGHCSVEYVLAVSSWERKRWGYSVVVSYEDYSRRTQVKSILYRETILKFRVLSINPMLSKLIFYFLLELLIRSFVLFKNDKILLALTIIPLKLVKTIYQLFLEDLLLLTLTNCFLQDKSYLSTCFVVVNIDLNTQNKDYELSSTRLSGFYFYQSLILILTLSPNYEIVDCWI